MLGEEGIPCWRSKDLRTIVALVCAQSWPLLPLGEERYYCGTVQSCTLLSLSRAQLWFAVRHWLSGERPAHQLVLCGRVRHNCMTFVVGFAYQITQDFGQDLSSTVTFLPQDRIMILSDIPTHRISNLRLTKHQLPTA